MDVLNKFSVLGTSLSVIKQETSQALERLSDTKVGCLAGWVSIYRAVIVARDRTCDLWDACHLLFVASTCYLLVLDHVVRRFEVLTIIQNSTAEAASTKVKKWTLPVVLWSCVLLPVITASTYLLDLDIVDTESLHASSWHWTVMYIACIIAQLVLRLVGYVINQINLNREELEDSVDGTVENECESQSTEEEANYTNYIRVRRFSARIAAIRMRQTWTAGLSAVNDNDGRK